MGNSVLARVLLIILSLILFASLVVFGLAFGTNRTVLNADFAAAQGDKLAVADLVNDVISRQTANDLSPDEKDAISSAIKQTEPRLKDDLRSAIHSVYDYLHGQRADPDLATVLRNTFLNSDTISAFIDNLDVVRIARTEINSQLDKEPAIPPEAMPFLKSGIEATLKDLEPRMKSQLKEAAGPVADYILGKSAGFSILVDLRPYLDSVKAHVHDAIRASPPPTLANVPAAQFDAAFDQYYSGFSAYVPVAVEFDQTLISPDIPNNVRSSIADIESTLRDIRAATRSVQSAFIVSLIVAIISILLMLVISRLTFGGVLAVGISFLLAGIVLLIGALVTRSSINTQALNSVSDAPAQLKTWLPQVVSSAASVFIWISVVYIVVGFVLAILSFVFRQRYLAGQAVEHHLHE